MGIFAYRIQIAYCGLEFGPSCGVIQRIPDGSKRVPRCFIRVVSCVLDEVGVGSLLAALAKALHFFKVTGQAISITTKAGRIWAGAEWHT